MKTTKIRHFRRILRRFGRVTHAHLKSCCVEVTLAQRHTRPTRPGKNRRRPHRGGDHEAYETLDSLADVL